MKTKPLWNEIRLKNQVGIVGMYLSQVDDRFDLDINRPRVGVRTRISTTISRLFFSLKKGKKRKDNDEWYLPRRDVFII